MNILSGILIPFNTLTINVPQYIETSQLISSANQLTGYYMMGKTDRSRVTREYPTQNVQQVDAVSRRYEGRSYTSYFNK